MMKKIGCILLGLIIMFCIACNSNKNEKPVAKVYDKYLYLAHLHGVVNEGTSREDSAAMIQTYINNWVMQQLLLRKAEKNLTKTQKNFDKEIEQYKNSLIIFKYQNLLVEHLLDTVVKDAEIEEYYNQHKNLFTLKSNIVRIRFAKVDKNNKAKNKIKQLIFTQDLSGEKLSQLAMLCEKEADNFFIAQDKWLLFNEVLKEIPITTYNEEVFLRNNRLLEIPMDDYIYFVNILDYNIKDNLSPLSFEKNRIAEIIVNRRKILLLENLRQELQQEAKQKNEIEIY